MKKKLWIFQYFSTQIYNRYINIFLDVYRYSTFFRNALVLLLGLYCPLLRSSSSNGRKCPNGNVAANWSKLWADYNEDKFYGHHPPQYPPAHAGVALNLKWSHFRGASITRHTHTITILSTTTRSVYTASCSGILQGFPDRLRAGIFQIKVLFTSILHFYLHLFYILFTSIYIITTTHYTFSGAAIVYQGLNSARHPQLIKDPAVSLVWWSHQYPWC